LNAGLSAADSDRALIIWLPIFGSCAQKGTNPQRRRSSRRAQRGPAESAQSAQRGPAESAKCGSTERQPAEPGHSTGYRPAQPAKRRPRVRHKMMDSVTQAFPFARLRGRRRVALAFWSSAKHQCLTKAKLSHHTTSPAPATAVAVTLAFSRDSCCARLRHLPVNPSP
jgi:hypothetical protein